MLHHQHPPIRDELLQSTYPETDIHFKNIRASPSNTNVMMATVRRRENEKNSAEMEMEKEKTDPNPRCRVERRKGVVE